MKLPENLPKSVLFFVVLVFVGIGAYLVLAPDRVELQVKVTPEGAGQIKLDPDQDRYEVGETVNLTVVPGEGYQFAGWKDQKKAEDVKRKREVTMKPADNTYTAELQRLSKLSVEAVKQARVTVEPEKEWYQPGQEVQVEVETEKEYRFQRWSDGNQEKKRSYRIRKGENRLQAVVEKIEKRSFQVKTKPDEAGTVSRQPEQRAYLPGTEVKLEAKPNKEWRFKTWSDGVDSPSRSYTIPDDNGELVAQFARKNVAVTVQSKPDEGGSVKMDGESPYGMGERVQIEARPSKGWTFVKWSDGNSQQNRSYTVPESDAKLTARFKKKEYDINVRAEPEEGGKVAQSGNPPYKHGETFQVRATPSDGWVFSQWSDGKTEPERSYSVSSNEHSLSAKFERKTYELTARSQPEKGGQVRLVDEERPIRHGENVRIEAVPEQGWRFSRWLDGKRTNPRTIKISGGVQLMAEFRPVLRIRTYGGGGMDVGRSVRQTKDGSYVFAGVTTSKGAGAEDAWLVKTGPTGRKQWERTYGGIGFERAESVHNAGGGGFDLIGFTGSKGLGVSDGWFIRTDRRGRMVGDRTVGRPGTDRPLSGRKTNEGDYILAGWTTSEGAGVEDAWLTRIDNRGRMRWDRRFGGTKNDYGRSVRQTKDGGFVVAGSTRSNGNGSEDGWLIRTDGTGREQWSRTFGGEARDVCNSLRLTSDGGYLLAGTTRSTDGGDADAWLIKTDSSGEKQWEQTFGGEGKDTARSLLQMNGGGFILAGSTASNPNSGEDIWLIKTDRKGRMQWDRTFGGENDDSAHSIQKTGGGGYIVTGEMGSNADGEKDAFLLKTDAQGRLADRGYSKE